MRTVALVVMLALGILSAPLAADAQQAGKVPLVGLLGDTPGPQWGMFRPGRASTVGGPSYQELLGHREFSMTLRSAHLAPDRLREAMASLEDFSTSSAQRDKIEPASLVSS